VALKLMTLAAPPVGIGADREAAIPRQIYDLDSLRQQVRRPEDWVALQDYAGRRYAKDVQRRDIAGRPNEAVAEHRRASGQLERH